MAVHLKDVEITHLKGSGPGGQNRNKRMSGIRIRHIPTGLVVVATERRSQAQNLAVAMERLSERIARLQHRPKPRFETKVPPKSDRKRLEKKKILSGRKQDRRRIRDAGD